jgi:RNA polymerase sigma-70 factor, ECF subfamily
MGSTGELTLGERFSQGDEVALSEIYRSYSSPMYVIALQMLGRHDLAADAVQRAFVQAWQASDRFDPVREIRPWLYAITRRAAIDVYRRERRTARTVTLDSNAVRDIAVEGPTLDDRWRAWQVRRALDGLHPDERDVLRLAYLRGHSQSEIAAKLGIAVGTVKSRTARGLRRLAASLTHLESH